MQEYSFARLADPRYFQENRLPACSDHIWYESEAALRQGRSAYFASLDGTWKFRYAENFAAAPADFARADVDCRGWADIQVPGHIQLQGYDAPQYVNVQYPWDGREEIYPGQIPQRFNPVASYVKYFTVPEAFAGLRVAVRFDGAESTLAVWCNGQYVGFSTDSFTPHAFELTPYLQPGENKLAVQVVKWSSASWCEDQDFFRFSGLFRSVTLLALPPVHLEDIRIATPLSADFSAGALEVTLRASGSGSVEAELSLAQAYGAPSGEPLSGAFAGQDSAAASSDASPAGNGGASAQGTCPAFRVVGTACAALAPECGFSLPVSSPALWSAEQPALYCLRLTVKDAAGQTVEIIEEKVGFRRFEIVDGLMRLNGKRIVFRGVNRHEFSAKNGRAVTREETVQDLLTMKRNNINAIRTCHYPNQSELYRLCDEYGLYLIDECNLETHGTWEAATRGDPRWTENIVPHNKPEWQALLLDRVNSVYQRDKNHPSVLLWSCGNESYGGKDIYEMAQLFRKLDGTRPVHYEGIFHDRSYPATSDIESQMYPSAAAVEAFLREHPEKPFLCCEYSHAMGNSCGGLFKYTELSQREPQYQGGFLWDYIDQALTRTDRTGKPYQAYGGDFNDRPTDYSFSGDGIVYSADRMPSPKMQEVKFCYQPIRAEVDVARGTVHIYNDNLFVSTAAYACVLRIENQNAPAVELPMATDVRPLSNCVCPLPALPLSGEGETVYTVSFRLKQDTPWAPAGYEVAFGQQVCGAPALPQILPAPLTIVPGTLNWGANGGDFSVLFSGLSHGLVSYRKNGRELLKNIPLPNFWRAPTENDNGNAMACRYGQWKLASLYCNPHPGNGFSDAVPEAAAAPEELSIRFTYTLPTSPRAECTLAYRVFGDGTIETTLHYEPVVGLSEMPEFGVLFKMDADFDRLTWYGLGPEETYADRCRGAKLGVWHTTAQESMARYLVPQECGNRMGVRWAKVTDAAGAGLLLWAARPMNVSLLPWTPHELENAAHPYELPPVHTSVVRLSLAQMGVGGDDSWGARTHPEFLLDVSKPLDFTFFMRAL